MSVNLQPRLLFIEDDEDFSAVIQRALAGTFEVVHVRSAERGWTLLKEDPAIDVILLDRNLPGMDGLGFLTVLRRNPALRGIPVVMQTGMATPEAIAEGLAAGVFYYLAKPYDRALLGSVLAAALADSRERRDLQEGLEAATQAVQLLSSGEFRFRTPTDVHILAPVLARAYPDPERVLVGISELLMNAVEHGNLALTFQEKTRHLRERSLKAELARRLDDERFAARTAIARFRRLPDRIELEVEDQGEGFEWKPFLELYPERALDPNGRGIAMARQLSFDRLEYQGRGNRVLAVVDLQG